MRPRKRCFEQRQRAFRIAAGAQHPTTLEIDAHLRDGARFGELLCLLQQPIAGVEVITQTLDSCELGEYLGAPRVFSLVLQLRPESLLRSVQIVEIPERP